MNKRKNITWLAAIAMACILILAAFIMISYVTQFKKSKRQTGFTVIDDYGRAVTVPKNPRRIISLAPGCTEIIFAVGLGTRVVGVDDNSNYPEAAKNITKIGSYLNPNLEVMVSLEPDLILASDMTSKECITSLKEKNLTVFVLAPKAIQGIIRDIRLVGIIGKKTKEADNLTNSLEQRINAITLKTKSNTLYTPRVYVEYYPYWTCGPESFGNDLISMAGGKNIAGATTTAYSEITNEFVVGSNPEIIVFTVGLHSSTTIKDIISRIGWDKFDAVKNNKIYTIDDDIISRPGPRIVDALEHLTRLIHPELFSLESEKYDNRF
jgi:iron complex transport system substrate-binding protein